MGPVTTIAFFAIETPIPQAGPDELVAYWPVLVRAAWFVAGFTIVVLIGWGVVVPAISRSIRRRNRRNPTIQEALTRYLRLVVLLIAILVAAGMAGYGRIVTSSAIVIAAATLALGVAGQTVIGSLISGLVLVLDPEFNVGNYIEWADKTGTVQSITLRVTRIRTANGELVTIPNTLLTSDAITRPFGQGHYRIVDEIELSYDDDIDAALELLEDTATDVGGILTEPPPCAFVEKFGADAVIIRVYYWIDDPRRRDVIQIRSRFARAVKQRLESAAFTISPASQHELHGHLEIDERTK